MVHIFLEPKKTKNRENQTRTENSCIVSIAWDQFSSYLKRQKLYLMINCIYSRSVKKNKQQNYKITKPISIYKQNLCLTKYTTSRVKRDTTSNFIFLKNQVTIQSSIISIHRC